MCKNKEKGAQNDGSEILDMSGSFTTDRKKRIKVRYDGLFPKCEMK